MQDHPKPSLTADALVLRPQAGGTAPGYDLLLIRRGNPPFAGRWALPGGFVDPGETTREAAIRELAEETGVAAEPFVEVGVADRPGRDPRGWTVSLVWGFVTPPDTEPVAGDDAREAAWFPWAGPPPLAFDHDEVLARARRRLREVLGGPDGWRALWPAGAAASAEAEAQVMRAFG